MENEYEKTKLLTEEIKKVANETGCIVVIKPDGGYVLDPKRRRRDAKSNEEILQTLCDIKDSLRLVSRIKTPDGTILTSEFTHDFVKYTDKNGEEYMLDGGLDYQRTYINKEPATDVSIYTFSPFEEIRKHVKRGTFDKNGYRIWKPVCELSDKHLENIIIYNEENGIPQSKFSDVIEREIAYRKEHGIKIEEYEY